MRLMSDEQKKFCFASFIYLRLIWVLLMVLFWFIIELLTALLENFIVIEIF